MTDELDPQTQQHIDDSADVIADTDVVTCDGIDIDDPILDESATAETPETENADEQNDDAPAQDDAPVQDDVPQAAGPIEVSSEEELDAVMDSMMDAVKAMKDAVADADIDAEEEADILSRGGTKASVVSNCLPYWLYKTSLNWAIQNPLRWEQNFG